jgi:AraC family transcriptional regulator, regulatory protein of adaptative response / methylated-DNA-[protein]-cysteine methyltransferase
MKSSSDSDSDNSLERGGVLNVATCEQARIARDHRYDGLFYIGVRTTKIYCRPICPARLALATNVRFYRSAAAAEAAGYRPCLRCRPETVPYSPAWKGTKATVERALRMIECGDLDQQSIDAFAERLGIGARHLSRLFQRHLGASPAQVARTARVQRAKRLLDQSDLSMMEIALQSGFGSLRRFNAVFAEVYRRPPSALRKTR